MKNGGLKVKRFFNGIILAAVSVVVLVFPRGVGAEGDVSAKTGYKRIKSPEAYGTVLMGKDIVKNGKSVHAVLFPHWAHRAKYQCRVCHTELGFALKANATNVKQADIEAGKYCGKCHDGKKAFAARECDRCHSRGIEVKENSKITDVLIGLPDDDFGNKINWGNAIKYRRIHPLESLAGKKADGPLDLDIVIPAEKYYPHPGDVTFPHKMHTEQLDCSTCHPAIFNQKKGGNPDMNMMKIISGQYCGACHGVVAFPLEDCFRCHNIALPKPVEKKIFEKKDKNEIEREKLKKLREKEQEKTIF